MNPHLQQKALARGEAHSYLSEALYESPGTNVDQLFWPTSLKYLFQSTHTKQLLNGKNYHNYSDELPKGMKDVFRTATFVGYGLGTDKSQFVEEVGFRANDEAINGDYQPGEMVGVLRLENGRYVTGSNNELAILSDMVGGSQLEKGLKSMSEARRTLCLEAQWTRNVNHSGGSGRNTLPTPLDIIRTDRKERGITITRSEPPCP